MQQNIKINKYDALYIFQSAKNSQVLFFLPYIEKVILPSAHIEPMLII